MKNISKFQLYTNGNPLDIQFKFWWNRNGNLFGIQLEFNRNFNWYNNGNPLDIQLKFQWNKNGNPFAIQLKFNRNFNEIPVGLIENLVEISIKYKWKSIGNQVAILINYQMKSIGNPVKIHLEI